jgi:von Willebrand factor type A domain
MRVSGGRRAALLLLLVVCVSRGGTGQVTINFTAYESGVEAACALIESRLTRSRANECGQTVAGCDALTLPGLTCSTQYGSSRTGGCSCNGAPFTRAHAVTILAPGAADQEVSDDASAGFDLERIDCGLGSSATLGADFGSVAQSWGLHTLWAGFQAGVLKDWPARDWKTELPEGQSCLRAAPECPPFDARVRPWYVSAATGPKNLVIVLDTSGSMRDKDRLDIAKSAASQVIGTLTFADYFSVVEYNSDADSWESELQQATLQNKGSALSWVDSLLPGVAQICTKDSRRPLQFLTSPAPTARAIPAGSVPT